MDVFSNFPVTFTGYSTPIVRTVPSKERPLPLAQHAETGSSSRQVSGVLPLAEVEWLNNTRQQTGISKGAHIYREIQQSDQYSLKNKAWFLDERV